MVNGNADVFAAATKQEGGGPFQNFMNNFMPAEYIRVDVSGRSCRGREELNFWLAVERVQSTLH